MNFALRRRRLKRHLFLAWLRSVGYLDRHLWSRWRRIRLIRRFTLAWWGLWLVLLVAFGVQFQGMLASALVERPVSGGTYSEGIVGRVKSINPILPEGDASADVSRLIFSGLTRINPQRAIEGDLAQSWSVSSDGKAYTFKLRRDVRWHDGAPLTARDVLFTLAAIQNPDTRSPLAPSWQGVRAEAADEHTVVFTLPNPYVPFIHSTTVGILPSHRLDKVEPASLRMAGFNQQPVGTGPFRLKRFDAASGVIQLKAHSAYHHGRPLLERFKVQLYDGEEALMEAYAKRQVTAMARLRSSTPEVTHRLPNVRLYDLALPNQTGLFLRTTHPALGDKAVRAALAQAVDRQAIARQAVGGGARVSNLPLLPGQLGYVTKFQPPAFDPAAAETTLDRAGWRRGDGGVRRKDGQPLKLNLVTSNRGDYPQVAEAVRSGWKELGAEINVVTADVDDLQQSHIRPRSYDVLLYGINLGADPDVYAYWHSSQAADPGLNLSGYASPVADKALEGARVTGDATVRAAKYGTFLSAWTSDVPAIMLYTPDYIYAVNADASGIVAKKMVSPSDRFYGVEKWSVRSRLAPR